MHLLCATPLPSRSSQAQLGRLTINSPLLSGKELVKRLLGPDEGRKKLCVLGQREQIEQRFEGPIGVFHVAKKPSQAEGGTHLEEFGGGGVWESERRGTRSQSRDVDTFNGVRGLSIRAPWDVERNTPGEGERRERKLGSFQA